MKKVFLIAYNRRNLGDDLFVRLILHRYQKALFCFRGEERQFDRFKNEKNIKVLTEDGLSFRIAKRMGKSFVARLCSFQEDRCNATVYIGGSIFIEYENWKTILTWWKYVAERRRFYVLGANFGPWHDKEYYREMKDIFSKMEDVCFRDKYSRELFSDVPTTRYAPDILFGYPMPKVNAKKNQAFISVINCASKDEGRNQLIDFDEAYTKSIAELTRRLIDQGWKVILSSFCKEEGDEDAIKKIRKITPESPLIEELAYDGTNTETVLSKLSESTIIYGTRFHAIILGFAAQRPVVPIIYSDKTMRVLENISFSGKSFDIRTIAAETGQELAEITSHTENQYLPSIDQLAVESEGHFKKLDQLLLGR